MRNPQGTVNTGLPRLVVALLGGLWLMMAGWTAHAQSLSEALHYLEAEKYQNEVFLPYQADQARIDGIHKGWNKLEPGQTIDEVRALIGAPDEIEAVFTKGERTEEIRCIQYAYIFSRSRSEEWGKAYDQSLIRLSFNLHGQLVSAQGYATPGFNELVRELGLGFQFEIGLHETVEVNDLLLRLDFLLMENAAKSPESSDNGLDMSTGSEASISVILPDRREAFKLVLGDDPEKRFKIYGAYKISLLAVPDKDVAILMVE
ncbi:MAG: hypothetical protein U0176_10720 [Bacteroidia bacterium]